MWAYTVGAGRSETTLGVVLDGVLGVVLGGVLGEVLGVCLGVVVGLHGRRWPQ